MGGEGNAADVVYLDFSKVFVKGPDNMLSGFLAQLIDIIQLFLSFWAELVSGGHGYHRFLS